MRSVSRRTPQAEETRARLLDAAERLYAENGVSAVSNRQVAEAAGQANNSAVAYHIGTKADLLTALCDRRAADVVRLSREVVAERGEPSCTRDHVATLVAPYVRMVAEHGSPGWTARFTAQLFADPACSAEQVWRRHLPATVSAGAAAAWDDAPELAPEVLGLRLQMIRILVIHTCAEREAAAARTGVPVDWVTVEEALVDAVTGLILAPTS